MTKYGVWFGGGEDGAADWLRDDKGDVLTFNTWDAAVLMQELLDSGAEPIEVRRYTSMGGRVRGSRGLMSTDEIEARYRFIWEYNRQHGMMPTYREMAEAWDVTTSVVQHTLKKFRGYGWLVTYFGGHRSGELLRQLD